MNSEQTNKAIEVSRRLDKLATERFGDAYTLKTTFWNDGDFRIMVYSSKDPGYGEIPDEAEKAYVEFWYQDSRMDNTVIEVLTMQTEDVPRDEARQKQAHPPKQINLPELDS